MGLFPQWSLVLFLVAGLEVPAYASVNVALRKNDTVPTCIREDDRSGHAVKPNCREVVERAGRKSEMIFNSQGLRDKDYPPTPKPGWTRILLLGSSTFVAPGLAEKDMPARLLEAKLRKLNPKIEVINASVEGYSIFHMLSRIPEWRKAYSPTLTILYMSLSVSVQSDLLYAPYLIPEGGSSRLTMQVHPWMKPFAWVFGWDKDYLGKRTALTWQSFLHRFYVSTKCRLTSKQGRGLTRCLLRPTVNALSAIRKIMESNGSRFVVTFHQGNFTNQVNLSPAFDDSVALTIDSITPSISTTDLDFSFILSQAGVPFQTMRRMNPAGLTLEGDYHFNEAGSNFIADEMVKIAARELGLASSSKPKKP